MYVMLYVLPVYNMVNSTSLMEKIHWEYRFPDAFATVYLFSAYFKDPHSSTLSSQQDNVRSAD
jgi:hypothetical protein